LADNQKHSGSGHNVGRDFINNINIPKSLSYSIAGFFIILSIILLYKSCNQQNYWFKLFNHKLNLSTSNWIGYAPYYLAYKNDKLLNWNTNFNTQTSRNFRRDVINGNLPGAYAGTIDEKIIDSEKEATYSTTPHYILTLANSNGGDAILFREGIDSIDNLVGKKIGAWVGGTAYYVLTYKLAERGIPISSVKFTHVEKPENLVSEFSKNNFDAIATWSPYIEKATEFADTIIRGSGSFGRPNIYDVLFIQDVSLLESHNEDFIELFEAWDFGVKRIRNISKEDVQLLGNWLEVSTDDIKNMLENVKFYTTVENMTVIDDWEDLVNEVERDCKFSGRVNSGTSPNITVYKSFLNNIQR